jgi:hypothetical protein
VERNVDYEAVKHLCERLGVEYESNAKSKELRDEVLSCLSRDVEKLASLAERGNVSLFDLSSNDLLPTLLQRSVNNHGHVRTQSQRNKSNECLIKNIGELTEIDCARLSQIRLVGKKTLSHLAELIELHRETGGFKTLIEEPLSAGYQISLIGRIVESVCTDPKMRRKLAAMFPPPAP